MEGDIYILTLSAGVSLNRAGHFLGLATLGSFAIFSFTTTPLIYAPYLYFLIPVLAYIALPLTIINKSNG